MDPALEVGKSFDALPSQPGLDKHWQTYLWQGTAWKQAIGTFPGKNKTKTKQNEGKKKGDEDF